MSKPRPLLIALSAVMTAFTTVATYLLRIPITATGGYLNFSDAAVYFCAFTFGPWVGLVAGGVGAALADLLGGYAQFAPLTLLAHGLQGLVVGFIARKRSLPWLLVAWFCGAVTMIGIYLLGEVLVMGIAWPQALLEVPLNALQNVVGAAVGIPLFYAVRKAYPPVTTLAEPRVWREG